MDQLYTNAYIRKNIEKATSFDELGQIMSRCGNLNGFSDIILRKIEALMALFPTYSSRFILELVRQMSISNTVSEQRDTWMNLLTVYSNGIINHGTFDKPDENLFSSQEILDTLAIVLFASTTDLERVNTRYLAASFWTYDVIYNEAFNDQLKVDAIGRNRPEDTDENYDHNHKIQTAVDLDWSPREYVAEIRNIRGNYYTKVDLILHIYYTWQDSDVNGKFDKRGEYVYRMILDSHMLDNDGIDCYEDQVMPFHPEDISYWISYFFVTLKSSLANHENELSLGETRAIQRKWMNSVESFRNNFPKLLVQDQILSKIIDEAILIFKQCVCESPILNSLKDLQSIQISLEPATEASTGKTAATSQATEKDEDDIEYEKYLKKKAEEKARKKSSKKNAKSSEDDSSKDDEGDTEPGDQEEDTDLYLSKKDIPNGGNYDDNMRGIDKAGLKIYKGYKAYKTKEEQVNSQLSKIINTMQKKYRDKKREEIIEGKKFSFVRVLKVVCTTAAIFSCNKVAGILYVIVKYFRSKNVNNQERQAVLDELSLEMKMLDEKIEDARGDGNRQAKYAMMRTRAELQKAYDQVRYGMSAGKRTLNAAKNFMTGRSNARQIVNDFTNSSPRDRY